MSWLQESRELLGRFRAGERKALESVYRHYAPKVSGLVSRGLGGRASPFEVGALVQEVFARAFQESARQSYGGLTPYLSYLSAIARNILLNERRLREDPAGTEAIDRALSGVEGGAALAAAPLGPQEAAEEKELAGLVERFLEERTEVERGVFRARFVERRTQEEAAAALGLSRIQVRRLEAHLRRDLLDRFKAGGYLERTTAQSSLLGPEVPEGVPR